MTDDTSPFGAKHATFGLDLNFCGDHKHHHVPISHDVDGYWDRDSLVLTINLSLSHANYLYWQLIELIPQLRKDQG